MFKVVDDAADDDNAAADDGDDGGGADRHYYLLHTIMTLIFIITMIMMMMTTKRGTVFSAGFIIQQEKTKELASPSRMTSRVTWFWNTLNNHCPVTGITILVC